ncbi:MAG TPA: C4-dicarboxylate transporter DctA [Gemmatimonadales bacterium]|nr:C4-dicarboxylate transporter DctA [Gemmatimonadales bacterium]
MSTSSPAPLLRRLAGNLTVQVLTAIAIGALLGAVAPNTARAMRPVGETFINLVRMVITPVIFLTIVLGMARTADVRRVGRVGGKALLYFEVVTTFALAIGLVVVNVIRPGDGIDASVLAGADVSQYAAAGARLSLVDFFTHIVPTSVVGAFAQGDVLQVVFFSILFGAALMAVGSAAAPVVHLCEALEKAFFRIVAIVMMVAPIGAFGAMAYTIGNFGLGSLATLGRLMLCVYLTMAIFILVVLNAIARISGFSLWRLLKYIRAEILVVLGTSSSEAVLPQLIDKMEHYGCDRSIVGLVIPAGYSFNLDGTSIYLSMATLFIAQAYHIHLALGQQLGVLAILMLTSKGAAGVTGSGFIVLASTLSALRVVPVEGVALVLGVDRFMSEARAITNVIGNAVATVVIARSEGNADAGLVQPSIPGV